MFTIEGTHGTVACYATNIENACVEQIRTMLGMPFAEGANTAIMPDAHFGIGCTIGTTMRVADAVVPNLVGVDIGCGMLTADSATSPLTCPPLTMRATRSPRAPASGTGARSNSTSRSCAATASSGTSSASSAR